MSEVDSTKICTKCETTHALDFFNKHSNTKDKLTTWCKACIREYSRHYYVSRKYYEANRERFANNNRKWRASNKEREAELVREWAKKNPEKRIASAALRRTRKAETLGEVPPGIAQKMIEDQGGLCAYCETPLFGTYEVDHMTPLSRGGLHDWRNFAITCPTCNRRKGRKTVEEFMRY